ncbi:GNAT family N-acetyltransferase [Afipia felis]
MTAKPAWRPMTAVDLPAVNAVAARVHPAYPEDEAVFAERLRLYPLGCHVLDRNGTIVAYAVSHPWVDHAPPPLNAPLGGLPARPSTYYLHDIALLPEARGSGAAVVLVAMLVAQAGVERLSSLSLIAVNGSAGFWRRQGFEAVTDDALAAKLRSYGDDAQFMMRQL